MYEDAACETCGVRHVLNPSIGQHFGMNYLLKCDNAYNRKGQDRRAALLKGHGDYCDMLYRFPLNDASLAARSDGLTVPIQRPAPARVRDRGVDVSKVLTSCLQRSVARLKHELEETGRRHKEEIENLQQEHVHALHYAADHIIACRNKIDHLEAQMASMKSDRALLSIDPFPSSPPIEDGQC